MFQDSGTDKDLCYRICGLYTLWSVYKSVSCQLASAVWVPALQTKCASHRQIKVSNKPNNAMKARCVKGDLCRECWLLAGSGVLYRSYISGVHYLAIVAIYFLQEKVEIYSMLTDPQKTK